MSAVLVGAIFAPPKVSLSSTLSSATFVLTSGITKPDVADPSATFVGMPRWDDAQSLTSYCSSFVGGRSAELAKLTSTSPSDAFPADIASKARDLARSYDECSFRVLGNGPIAEFSDLRSGEAYLVAAAYTSSAAERRNDLTLAIARAQRAEDLQLYQQVLTNENLLRLQTGGEASITGVLVKPWTDAIVTYARRELARPMERRSDP